MIAAAEIFLASYMIFIKRYIGGSDLLVFYIPLKLFSIIDAYVDAEIRKGEAGILKNP